MSDTLMLTWVYASPQVAVGTMRVLVVGVFALGATYAVGVGFAQLQGKEP